MAETSDLAIAFPARLPTTDEMVEFDRAVQGDDDYPSWYRTGDVVLLAVGDDSDRVALADALERTGFCDMAHVVSDASTSRSSRLGNYRATPTDFPRSSKDEKRPS